MTTYSQADTHSQWFADDYQGTIIRPNVLVLHTTEGSTWPTYGGGASAPHLTAMPDRTNKKVLFRQHYPFEVSARALRNLPGGVETNTLNCVQIELVGTCAPGARAEHPTWMFWPEAPGWALAGLAEFVAELHEKFASFPLTDAAPRGWLAYPDSYGNANRQRMTTAEWQDSVGVLGHQHVPENDHGDPGNFPIAQLLDLAGPEKLTQMQRVRRTLKAMRERAIIAGKQGRAERIQAALDILPKE